MTGAQSPTVVLVHGAFADASGFAGVIRELKTTGYDVIAPPNRGCRGCRCGRLGAWWPPVGEHSRRLGLGALGLDRAPAGDRES